MVSLDLRIEAGECRGVRGAMAHELPTALFHFLDGLRIDVADLRIQRHRRSHSGFIEDVGKSPQADPHSVFPPGVVEDVGHMVGGIGRNADPESRVVLPDLHIGREPDRNCVVAGPFERLALGDETVVIALRPPDRPRRRLGPGDAGHQRGCQQAHRPGEAQALRNEFSTVMTIVSHGAALHSQTMPAFGNRASLSLRRP
jgi:hypothetical protein